MYDNLSDISSETSTTTHNSTQKQLEPLELLKTLQITREDQIEPRAEGFPIAPPKIQKAIIRKALKDFRRLGLMASRSKVIRAKPLAKPAKPRCRQIRSRQVAPVHAQSSASGDGGSSGSSGEGSRTRRPYIKWKEVAAEQRYYEERCNLSEYDYRNCADFRDEEF